MAETLNFRETTKSQLESPHKHTKSVRAEIGVLCSVVAALSSNRGELSKVKIRNLKPLVVQRVLKNWKTSSRIWNSTLLLQGCLKLTS